MKAMKISNDRYSVGRMSLGIFCCAALICSVLQAVWGVAIPLNAYVSSTLATTAVELYLQEGQVVYALVGALLAVLALVPYLLCWCLTKKRRGWLLAAAIMLALETLLLLLDALTVIKNGEVFYLFGFLCHVVLLVPVVLAVVRKKQPEQKVEEQAAEEQAEEEKEAK